MYDAIQLIGWVGTVLLLMTAGLLTFGKLTESGSIHLGVNFIAPLVIAISTAALHEWPLTTANAIRLVIGLIPILRVLRERTAADDRHETSAEPSFSAARS